MNEKCIKFYSEDNDVISSHINNDKDLNNNLLADKLNLNSIISKPTLKTNKTNTVKSNHNNTLSLDDRLNYSPSNKQKTFDFNSLSFGGHFKKDSINEHIEEIFLKEKLQVELTSKKIDSILIKLEQIVIDKEKQRNYKLNSDFQQEKVMLENQQNKIKKDIEGLTFANNNENYIAKIKEEKNKHQELFNKYYKLNTEAVSKINEYNELVPVLEDKIIKKKSKLKDLNHENLQLLEQLNNIKANKIKEYKEKLVNCKDNKINKSYVDIEPNKKYNINENSNSNNNNNNISYSNNYNNNGTLLNNSLKKSERYLNNSKLKYSEYGNNSKELNKSVLNITEVIDENNYLKDLYSDVRNQKTNLKLISKKNKLLSNEISYINMQIFNLGKIFSRGMFEIGLELRKLQEIQLNKVIEKNNYGNSLYFELVKNINPSNISGTIFPLSKDLKLPIIHNNIIKKYSHYNQSSSDPKTYIYNVVKNMIEEHQYLNKSLEAKKRKFGWEEFLSFNAYQIYTILIINKDAIKELEKKLFPKSFSSILNNSNKTNSNNNNNSSSFKNTNLSIIC